MADPTVTPEHRLLAAERFNLPHHMTVQRKAYAEGLAAMQPEVDVAADLLSRCLAELPNLRDPNGFPDLADAVREFLKGKATGRCVRCTYIGNGDLYQVCGHPDCENATPPES